MVSFICSFKRSPVKVKRVKVWGNGDGVLPVSYVLTVWNKYKCFQVSKGMIMKLGDDNFNIEMVGYQAGSVDAYFAFLLQGQKWIGTKNFTDYLTEVVTKMLDNKTAVTVTGNLVVHGTTNIS